MKFSLKWLGDFIPIKDFAKNPEKLAETLTQSGLEVDSFLNQKEEFQNLVVAKIESVKKHPDADRLTVCRVSDSSKTYQIVCGAKNHKVGDKVVLAQVGALLPGDFKIKKTKIRGVESEGMLASKEELGFLSQEEGIWILPTDAKVGSDFSSEMSLDDVIFDITVPPNRSDCLSHKGLAREIAGLFSLSFSVKKTSLDFDKKVSVKKSLSVKVEDSGACPRYCGRLIEGVKIKESPEWLKKRLQSLGLKSINNVVDITNFVLWDRGQPLHAFDADKVQSIQVGEAPKTSFVALDEQKYSLSKEDLAIKDKNQVLALAGVIGGMDSSITGETKNLFIEAAGFAPEKIRKTSRRLGLETDSSYRFTRGIDWDAVHSAMDWACFLISQEAGGKVSKDSYDIYKKGKGTQNIKISLEDISDRLGYKASAKNFEAWMKRLGCKVLKKKDSFQVLPPSYRKDLGIKEDLIEEFARLEGYDKIPENSPSFSGSPYPDNPRFLSSKTLSSFLSGRGFQEAIHYSFCDPVFYKEFLKDQFYLEDLGEEGKKDSLKKTFSLNNPISQGLSLMKPLLTPDIVKNVINNIRYNNKVGQIFELSPVFYQSGEDYKQELHLALTKWGEGLDIWKGKKVPNVYYVKNLLESVFEAFRMKGCRWQKTDISFLHPGQSLALFYQNRKIGFVGSLHPLILQKYKIPVDTAVAEIYWDFLDDLDKKPFKFKTLSRLLIVEKDLCFVIPKETSVEDVKKEIQGSLNPLCERVDIFDIYEKEGSRSVSFRMYLRPEDKAWTDQQLQDFLNKAISSVGKKLNIHLK